MGVNGGTARPEALRDATGEEPRLDGNSTVTDDGHVPKPTGSSCPEGSSVETKRIRLRNLMRIATWNVRSMSSGKLSTVISEATRYNIDILGIAEHRWAGQGHFRPEEGGMFVFSGRETTGYGGVGMYLAGETSKALLGYNPINDRVLTVRLQGRPMNITLIQVYAPTSTATQDEIDEFYDSVKQAVDKVPASDMLVLMGDFNAKIGEGFEIGEEDIIGSFGLGVRNERGESLVSFATENELIVCNTWFKQHKRRLYTWTAPDGKTLRLIISWCEKVQEQV